jgi:3-methyladenine DNA glycosylase AlkD
MKARSRSSSIPTKRFESSRQPKSRQQWTCRQCLAELRRLGSRKNVEGMARFGIRAKRVYGVSKPKMDILARRVGKSHELALQLWKSGVHDARILAGMVDQTKLVTAAQMDRWVRDFDNWDVCDGTCCHLFAHTPLAWSRAVQWSRRSLEFQKRAGFALMAYLAVHDKRASDHQFVKFLPIIRREATDDRNFVRKAINWALRQIGKRNLNLNRAAIREGERIRRIDSRSALWIAADALRELRSEAVQRRLRQKALNRLGESLRDAQSSR